MALAAPSEPGSLVRRAIDAVSGHIRSQNLKVGDTLPGEGHFAAELGVSRAVMREAFGALTALRLIEVANGRRPRVAAIDGSVIAASLDHAMATAQISIAEVWDVRRTIEMRTAALAAEHRSDAQSERIAALVDAMARQADIIEDLTHDDIEFHNEIARASGNALFLQIVTSFGPLMEVAVPAAWRTRPAARQQNVMIERHRAVAVAIAVRNPAAAAAAMGAHFDTSIGDVLKAGEESAGG